MAVRVAFVLLVLGLTYGLRLGSHALIDYDEAVYAQASREMHERGDVLLPTVGGEPFVEKPPMLYWSQYAGYALLGTNEWGARGGNALAGLALLFVVFALTRRTLGDRSAIRSAWVLGTATAYLLITRIAVTDLLFTLWMITSLLCAHRALETKSRRWFLAASAAAGLAMLAKGLVGILLPGGALLIHALLTKRVRVILQPTWVIPGMLLALLVGSSWTLALGATHGFEFLEKLFGEHHVSRFLEPMQGHAGPFWYYLPVLLLGFLPWTAFLLPARWAEAKDEPSRHLIQLLWIYALLALVFFSISATKLVNYVTPIFPCFAIITAAGMERVANERPRGEWAMAAWISVAGTFGLAGLVFFLPTIFGALPYWVGDKVLREFPGLGSEILLSKDAVLGVGGAFLLVAVLGAIVCVRGTLEHLVRITAATAVVGTLLVVFCLLPVLDAHLLRPLGRIARTAAANEGEAPVALVGIRHRPSTLFYGIRRIEYVPEDHAPSVNTLFAGPDARIALTTSAMLSDLTARGEIEVIARDTGYVLVHCLPR